MAQIEEDREEMRRWKELRLNVLFYDSSSALSLQLP
jgi:hypothetical protein